MTRISKTRPSHFAELPGSDRLGDTQAFVNDMGGPMVTGQSEVGTIKTVIVKHARDAFQDQTVVAAEWQNLNYTGAPDFALAVAEYDAFLDLLRSTGCEAHLLPPGVGLDSIYVRDAAVVCDRGAILCRMESIAHRRTE